MLTTAEILILALAAVGVIFMFIAGIGVIRLPDIYSRSYAAGKATTLGISCILLAVGLYYGEWILVRMLVLLALFFVTNPIAASAMGRAAYRTDRERRFILHYDELATHEAKLRGEPFDGPDYRG
jgi:multicomponent Na+:H+ antiporter subunit G